MKRLKGKRDKRFFNHLFFLVFILLSFYASVQAIEIISVLDPKTGQMREVVKGEILVKFKEGTTPAKKIAVHKGVKGIMGTPTISIPSLGIESVKISTQVSLLQAIEEFKKNPEVEFAEPNGIVRAAGIPNDPMYPFQWGLHKTEAAKAWDITTGNRDVVVAVIDTGINYKHQDFGGGIGPNFRVVGGYDFVNKDDDPTDDDGHGTHVAGIIGALTNDTTGMVGLNWDVKLLAVKVLNAQGSGTDEWVAQGIDFARQNGANIINLSLGSPTPSETVRTAVNRALASNITIVAASGNDACNYLDGEFCKTKVFTAPVGYPAAFPGVIAVGASDLNDKLAVFSNSGKELALVAPGVDVFSSVLSGYAKYSGTSMAASHVAGVAALILSVRPGLSPSGVRAFLTGFTDDLDVPGFDTLTGHGRLNAFRSVQAAQRGFAEEVLAQSVPFPNPFLASQQATVSLSVPQEIAGNNLRIHIFNMRGSKVRTIVDTNFWDGKNDDGHLLSSGLYFYKMETDKGKTEGQLTLVR